MTDTRNLYSKVMVENARGIDFEDLLIFEKANGITINGESKTSRQGIINFETLKENSKNFKDPTTGGDYIFGYAEGKITRNGEQEFYSFVQLATISEKENTTKLVGNYFQYDEKTDSKSILSDDLRNILEDGGKELAYETEGELGCSEFPHYVVNLNEKKEGTPTKINQARQNTNSNGACYYSCTGDYTSKFCDKKEITNISECGNQGELYYLKNSKYGNCDTNDIVVCSELGKGYILASCNAGANIAGTHTDCTRTTLGNCTTNKVGYHYQWMGDENGGKTGTGYAIVTNDGKEITAEEVISQGFITSDLEWNTGDTWTKNTPCEYGYSIPSDQNWIDVVIALNDGMLFGKQLAYGNKAAGAINSAWSSEYKDILKSALLLPSAGNRISKIEGEYATATVLNQDSWGFFWTSNSHVSSNISAYALRVYNTHLHPQGSGSRNGAFSVRCFKNQN